MKKLIWPEVEHHNVWFQCHMCNALISAEVAGEDKETKRYWFTPASRYWNVSQHRVYCGVDCSWRDLNAAN